MSEVHTPSSTTLDWEPQPQPAVWAVRPPRPRWWLYGLFLALTMFSTMVVGARMQYNFAHRQPVFLLTDDSLSLFPVGWIVQNPSNLLLGLPFSLTLMFILFAHEMGHYLYARHYRVYVTPPFFVPCPYLSWFGTLGAFIRIKSSIPSRAALFDIGVAGPVAGFIPACAALFYGLSLSQPLSNTPAQAVYLGFPLIFYWAGYLLHIPGSLSTLSLHPIAAAAWVGMFATALNLLPVGQLDGGHILFSVSPRLHRAVSIPVIAALVPLGYFSWIGWFVWGFLLTYTLRHPSVPRYPDVARARRVVAIVATLILVVTFTPAPFAHTSGGEVWPQIRNGSRETLHDIRDYMHHKFQR